MKICWNVWVSPRSPRKIRDELIILERHDGRKWSRSCQADFVRDLERSSSYEGAATRVRNEFFARDRVAPMKTYGFVYQDPGSKTIHITDAGHALIARRTLDEEQRIFARQLAKWQFPSPQHRGKDYEDAATLFGDGASFAVHPFYAALFLVDRLDGLTKFEIAMGLLRCVRDVDVKKQARALEKVRIRRGRSASKKKFDRTELRKA